MENNIVTTTRSITETPCDLSNNASNLLVRVYESPTTKWIIGGLFLLKFVDMIRKSNHSADIRYGDAEISLTKNDTGNS